MWHRQKCRQIPSWLVVLDINVKEATGRSLSTTRLGAFTTPRGAGQSHHVLNVAFWGQPMKICSPRRLVGRPILVDSSWCVVDGHAVRFLTHHSTSWGVHDASWKNLLVDPVTLCQERPTIGSDRPGSKNISFTCHTVFIFSTSVVLQVSYLSRLPSNTYTHILLDIRLWLRRQIHSRSGLTCLLSAILLYLFQWSKWFGYESCQRLQFIEMDVQNEAQSAMEIHDCCLEVDRTRQQTVEFRQKFVSCNDWSE